MKKTNDKWVQKDEQGILHYGPGWWISDIIMLAMADVAQGKFESVPEIGIEQSSADVFFEGDCTRMIYSRDRGLHGTMFQDMSLVRCEQVSFGFFERGGQGHRAMDYKRLMHWMGLIFGDDLDLVWVDAPQAGETPIFAFRCFCDHEWKRWKVEPNGRLELFSKGVMSWGDLKGFLKTFEEPEMLLGYHQVTVPGQIVIAE